MAERLKIIGVEGTTIDPKSKDRLMLKNDCKYPINVLLQSAHRKCE
jgi:hypothetical protein